MIQPISLQSRVFQVNYLAGRRRGQTDVRVSSGSISTAAPGAQAGNAGPDARFGLVGGHQRGDDDGFDRKQPGRHDHRQRFLDGAHERAAHDRRHRCGTKRRREPAERRDRRARLSAGVAQRGAFPEGDPARGRAPGDAGGQDHRGAAEGRVPDRHQLGVLQQRRPAPGLGRRRHARHSAAGRKRELARLHRQHAGLGTRRARRDEPPRESSASPCRRRTSPR